MTWSLGIEPGPPWWEASALTTAPSLLPKVKHRLIHRSFEWSYTLSGFHPQIQKRLSHLSFHLVQHHGKPNLE